jgi:ribosome maturation factor RimP
MSDVLEKIREFIEPLLVDTDMFIVSIKIKPTNNVKVFLDADEGLSISKSASINRQLRKQIEESGLLPVEDYSLEVSSPGVDEPLLNERQYKKNIGRTVLVTLLDGTEHTGVLKEMTDTGILLEVKIPKKKETLEVAIPAADIKTTIVQIIF